MLDKVSCVSHYVSQQQESMMYDGESRVTHCQRFIHSWFDTWESRRLLYTIVAFPLLLHSSG
jgi:hypothetical protein